MCKTVDNKTPDISVNDWYDEQNDGTEYGPTKLFKMKKEVFRVL